MMMALNAEIENEMVALNAKIRRNDGFERRN